MNAENESDAAIRTPDQRLRVFVSSTLGELAAERAAVARAISALGLTPVMFELGARPHPPQELYRAYLDAIRSRACTVCLDQRDDGTCRLPHSRVCAIENHLPALVEALLKIDSNRMDEYEQAIRAQVCGTCPAQHDDQRCGYRDKGECALWTYLPLVVDAVFDVHKAFALAPRPAAGRK